MDEFELRLLTREEAYIDDEDETKTTALKVLQDYNAPDPSLIAVNTDLACLMGSYSNANTATFYSLQPNLNDKKFYYVDDGGFVQKEDAYDRQESVRPVLHFFDSTAYRKDLFYNFGIQKLQYGEYPQYILDENAYGGEIANVLNTKLLEQSLTKTGKKYCFYYGEDGKAPSICYRTEYLYKGKKYVPFILIPNNYGGASLSTKNTISPYRIYWLKVEPITWLYDEDTHLFISEKALVAGVGFEFVKEGQTFESTEMYEFLNTHLKQDIIPSRIVEEDKSSLLDSSETLKKYVYKNYGRRG